MNNEIIETAAQNETVTYSYISEWMVPSQATDWIKSLITEGSYKKGEIKKSSPRFANGKDKTDGYEVRVIAVTGIKPELEKAVVGYRKLIEKKVRHTLNEEQKELVAKFKKMLAFENIKEISESCVKFNDGSRIQLFTKKGN